MDSHVRETRPLILLIDDSPVALRVRTILIESAGYGVIPADSGEAALEVFTNTPVDLVVSDHFLAGRSGTDTASEMKSRKPWVPILIHSASAATPEGIEYADEFLPKASGTEVFLDTIRRLLRQ